jgi:hypothetical protein
LGSVAAISESTATSGGAQKREAPMLAGWGHKPASARGCGETSIKSQAVSRLNHSRRTLLPA